MTTELQRDLRKVKRAHSMRSRATELYSWHDSSRLDRQKPARRKLKRAVRLFKQADRIMEVRLIRFTELRRQGLWPRP